MFIHVQYHPSPSPSECGAVVSREITNPGSCQLDVCLFVSESASSVVAGRVRGLGFRTMALRFIGLGLGLG